jgi:hypothetical protein
MLRGMMGVPERDESGLLQEIQRAVAPMRIVSRPKDDSFVADLLSGDGRVAVPEYATGPNPLLAALAAEQRYLVEQQGAGSVRGTTYLDKAVERLRRWTQPASD